ncbi:unnamed protein product, partial [Larinioides sclopetarius]
NGQQFRVLRDHCKFFGKPQIASEHNFNFKRHFKFWSTSLPLSSTKRLFYGFLNV